MNVIRYRLFNFVIKPVILACIVLPGLPLNLAAQKVTTRLDPETIIVGDQARIFLEVQKEGPETIEWPHIPDTFNTLEIREKGIIDTIAQGGDVVYRQRLLVTGFDSGVHTIPPFIFNRTSNGISTSFQSDSLLLHVSYVAADTSKPFMGIKDVITVKASWMDYLLYIIGAVVLLINVAVGVYLGIRNIPKSRPEEAPKVIETAQQKAMRLLQDLEQKSLWQNNKIKAYYIALTDILRMYIEDRFATNAMELTTDEILLKARVHKEMRVFYESLKNILQTADLAKFAKAQPLPDAHIEAMNSVKEFIISTQEQIQPQTEVTKK